MKRILIVLATVLVVVVLGGWLADRKLKAKAHPGLRTFLHQWWVNYPASFAVEPLELAIQVDQRDINALEGVVQAARERGVIMPEGNDYVPAELSAEGVSFKARLRIKGKMSDHVQGSKWSFRVIAKKDAGFMGMQRFSLQHPGTRNYLCDWFFHRLMQGEGIIALRYGFIRLSFNGEDLGVYAYEEHFGPELLANNNRLEGPLFRFDPGLFWEHRLNMLKKVRYDEPFGTYQAAAVDAFGSSSLAKDPVQQALFEKAVARMDAFRRGQLRASEVFDADKLARRHAILDLIGGHHSMDWSDVKFYFDPKLERIEPVAYESFSAFPIRSLAGSNRYIGRQDQNMDLHDAYFNDPVVFSAYVAHLERVSRPSYLDSVFTALGPALDSASALIYREFPYKELDRSIYRKNQVVIRKMLDVPKGFHAYLGEVKGTAKITIVPIEGLPIEVLGLVAPNGALLPPIAPVIVPCRVAGKLGVPLDIEIPLRALIDPKAGRPWILRYRVLGASTSKELEVFPYSYLDGLDIPGVIPTIGADIHSFPFFSIDDGTRTVRFIPGKWTLATDVVIPAGYSVRAIAPLQLDLIKGARIVSASPMEWKGSDDLAIKVSSSDSSGGGLVLLGTGGTSRFDRVRFEGFGRANGPVLLVQDKGRVELSRCDLGASRGRDLLMVVRGDVRISDCSFTGGRDQVTLAYSSATLNALVMRGAGDDGLVMKGGQYSAHSIAVEGARGSGVVINGSAVVEMNASRISSIKDALHIAEGSTFSMKGGGARSEKGDALDVQPLHARHGVSKVELKGVALEAGSINVGRGNSVSIDGKEQAARERKEP